MIDREMSQLQAEYEADQFTLCPPSLDFPSILCHTNSIRVHEFTMTYTRDQLITALTREYDYLCHDCPADDDELTAVEYAEFLQSLTLQQLIDETSCEDNSYTLDEYLTNWL